MQFDELAMNKEPRKFCAIEDALEVIRDGQIVVVVDDEDRENEGDFAIAAEKSTPELVNCMDAGLSVSHLRSSGRLNLPST
jgi:hypothetical protein